MRIADYRLAGIGGVIYLTEGSFLRFGEDLLLSWRYDGALRQFLRNWLLRGR